MSPEALIGQCDENTDIWAIGVIAYILFYKKFPFDSKKDKKIPKKILKSEIKFTTNN